MISDALFFVFAGLTLICGLLTVANPFSRNPITSAIFLVLTILSLAGLFVLLHAFFLAAIQVLIYAGAVMVLFLFVIMLIGVDKAENRTENLPLQRPAALALMALFGAGVVFAGRSAWVTGRTVDAGVPINGSIEQVGGELFTNWLLPFEITALLLIIAAAGAIALAFFRDDGEVGG